MTAMVDIDSPHFDIRYMTGRTGSFRVQATAIDHNGRRGMSFPSGQTNPVSLTGTQPVRLTPPIARIEEWDTNTLRWNPIPGVQSYSVYSQASLTDPPVLMGTLEWHGQREMHVSLPMLLPPGSHIVTVVAEEVWGIGLRSNHSIGVTFDVSAVCLMPT
jgi:hypothetical protein